ncbi:type II toxin-antitoxin system VapC family toxin [Treponema ruminis]|jgi:PIN domain nuclease of toxin-antitoxin system|uniref:PIN domain nuclease of toxin-antitoxin system n=1 Tax=Treponema ruminis TaxID=744515 RepID=A0A7W8G768_9SPIR|nr:type II toxin-antitoxin system VapC family toxin [Treponema ruminis]MBB5225142.1 PIN domain nuclease of toxin-antitoxin system [Treponema ruminis]QSI01063.1 type II toxin-antitoxin system VapC family toxin [Treponema ruminis]
MKYLLDTHAILWYAQGNNELSEKARSIMESEECFYSMASLWEIAIKQKLGKLDETLAITELDELCRDAGFIQIPMTSSHVEKTKTLDFIHRDPFDRLIIALAQSENLTIITRDTIIPKYDVKTVW